MSQSNALEIEPATFIAEQDRQEADEAARIQHIVYEHGSIGWAQALKLSHLHTRRFSWHVRRLADLGAITIIESATGYRPRKILSSPLLHNESGRKGDGRVKQEGSNCETRVKYL